MSWNEPGNDKKDPWSGRGDEKGPPDLDEAIRSLQEKLGKFFGGGNGDNEGSPRNFSPANSMKSFGFLAGGAVILWGLSGFYIVDEGNHGVETRFGRYIGTTQSGLNWHIPAPIERVDIVNVKQQRFIEVGYRSSAGDQVAAVPKEALMLTKDEFNTRLKTPRNFSLTLLILRVR
jgi:membrane protease subunit HflK